MTACAALPSETAEKRKGHRKNKVVESNPPNFRAREAYSPAFVTLEYLPSLQSLLPISTVNSNGQAFCKLRKKYGLPFQQDLSVEQQRLYNEGCRLVYTAPALPQRPRKGRDGRHGRQTVEEREGLYIYMNEKIIGPSAPLILHRLSSRPRFRASKRYKIRALRL